MSQDKRGDHVGAGGPEPGGASELGQEVPLLLRPPQSRPRHCPGAFPGLSSGDGCSSHRAPPPWCGLGRPPVPSTAPRTCRGLGLGHLELAVQAHPGTGTATGTGTQRVHHHTHPSSRFGGSALRRLLRSLEQQPRRKPAASPAPPAASLRGGGPRRTPKSSNSSCASQSPQGFQVHHLIGSSPKPQQVAVHADILPCVSDAEPEAGDAKRGAQQSPGLPPPGLAGPSPHLPAPSPRWGREKAQSLAPNLQLGAPAGGDEGRC